MMARNYGLWGAIAGIFLLALLGVRSAVNWLNGSTTANRASDQTVSIEGNDSRGDLNRDDVIAVEGDRTQTNARLSDRSDVPVSETLAFTPLETAGTYVQRQKRAERDAVVASTTVEAVPMNTASNPVAEQSNTPVKSPVSSADAGNPSSAAQPAAPSAPAVPALW